MNRSTTLSGSGPLRITHPRSLPHWYRSRAAYFITFRLADSVPVAVMRKLGEELLKWRATHPEADDDLQARTSFARMEQMLHGSPGACLQGEAEYDTVRGALLHFNGIRYQLAAWCIMPNHVHVVLQLCGEHQIAAVVQSWKRFTSTRINAARGERGALWQKEYFDRLIRDGEELARCVRYTLANPVKAGLVEWPWLGQ